jgi:hypothetical protein
MRDVISRWFAHNITNPLDAMYERLDENQADHLQGHAGAFSTSAQASAAFGDGVRFLDQNLSRAA